MTHVGIINSVVENIFLSIQIKVVPLQREIERMIMT